MLRTKNISVCTLAIAMLLTFFVTSTFAQDKVPTKIRVYTCDGVNVDASWEPAGPPNVGDAIKIKNMTSNVITDITYGGADKGKLGSGSTSLLLGYYQNEDAITFCALCEPSTGPSGCVDDPDLSILSPTLTINYDCTTCEGWQPIPSITTWGGIILVLLILSSGLFILRRRRRAVA